MKAKIVARDLHVWYRGRQALKSVSVGIPARRVTALIGPPGCGKTTFLRCLNRMNDVIDGVRIQGRVELDGKNIYARDADAGELRRRVAMIHPNSTPFPESIHDNIAYGALAAGVADPDRLESVVEESARRAAIWEDVRDRLHEPALSLPAGLRQRVCIARAVASGPEVFLMDEPAPAYDCEETAGVEQTIRALRDHYTVVVVTHDAGQATRVSDLTAYFFLGELVEFAPTEQMFTSPAHRSTENYLAARLG